MVAPCDGEVNMGMIAIDMQRSHPRPIGKFLAREIQGSITQPLGVRSRRHRKDHRNGSGPLATGIASHLPFLPVLREDLHVSGTMQHLLIAGVERDLFALPMPQTADVGKVGKDMTTAMLAPRRPHHHLRHAPRCSLHCRDGAPADGSRRAPQMLASPAGQSEA
jgi:hypothetical protein